MMVDFFDHVVFRFLGTVRVPPGTCITCALYRVPGTKEPLSPLDALFHLFNSINMLRSRDFVALVAALILTRMAWNDSTESLQASANLAFYLPRDGATVVSPMDVDGDGTNEAIAVVQRSADQWEWKILDLKALHPRKGSSRPGLATTALPPFQPPILFSSKDDSSFRNAHVKPIQITTGQVLVKPPGNPQKKMDLSNVDSETEINDRNRHYFCGTDWHDAAQKCSHPCPTGQASECPEDQRCFADTPCDLHEQKQREETQVMFELTPGGGLPSVITLWSDGVLALSSLMNHAADKNPKSSLELKPMWHVQLLPNASHPQNILWVESNILFLDAYESIEAVGASHGMIVVSGTYVDASLTPETSSDEDQQALPRGGTNINSFLIAVDAMKGQILWDTFSDDQKNNDPVPLPLTRGATSYARRRSRVPTLIQSFDKNQEKLPNCQVTYRQHLRQVLPYAYWTSRDSHLTALHLDQVKKRQSNKNNKKQDNSLPGKDDLNGHQPPPKKKWHHRFQKSKHPTAVKGRPNVLVTQTRGGMQIRSLRNGRPMCHMSLLEETLYADLNNDGTIDQVQILLSNKKIDKSDKWIRGLLNSIQKDKEATSTQRGADQAARASRLMSEWGSNLCHAMALSGLPAREELFSTSLCGSAHERVAIHPVMDLDSVAPVVVESLSGRRNTRDVVVALNNGMVHRLQGRSGYKEWTQLGLQHEDFPTWEESSTSNALLTRVQSTNVPPPLRPILLVGENSLAILSVKNGNILTLVPFPQTSNSRPFLGEVSGDGTTDVFVMSMDGIWGFRIQVLPGRPVALRITVGILLFLLMLAILQNRFGQRKNLRATDLQ